MAKTPEQIHYNMSRIRSKDTQIEVKLRKELWSRGLRYRKNVRSVPGKPDVAFIGKKVAVFCDSEFWHGYDWDVRKAAIKTNREYWIPKIERNMERYRKDGFGLWAVILKKTGEMIGDCGLTMQRIDGELLPEIGYHIRRDCQRRGYASEAGRAVRDWAFDHTAYDCLYSYMKYTNVPSYSTAMAAGMKKIKQYPDAQNGITFVFGISREEWRRLKETALKGKLGTGAPDAL